MFKQILSLSISLLVFNAFACNVAARANVRQETDAAKIEKVKEGVRQLGIGPEARVEVKLVDGRKFKGYIKDSSDENFVVVDKKSRAEITV
ncbi:MAG TPA: hypothetical protein VF074_14095, partial [Pyrinomonadaceae bacterium]